MLQCPWQSDTTTLVWALHGWRSVPENTTPQWLVTLFPSHTVLRILWNMSVNASLFTNSSVGLWVFLVRQAFNHLLLSWCLARNHYLWKPMIQVKWLDLLVMELLLLRCSWWAWLQSGWRIRRKLDGDWRICSCRGSNRVASLLCHTRESGRTCMLQGWGKIMNFRNVMSNWSQNSELRFANWTCGVDSMMFTYQAGVLCSSPDFLRSPPPYLLQFDENTCKLFVSSAPTYSGWTVHQTWSLRFARSTFCIHCQLVVVALFQRGAFSGVNW